MQRSEHIAILLAALDSLPENQRRAIVLKHLQGYTLKEVSVALGISEPATAGLLHRGRRQLLQRIEGDPP